MGKKETKDKKPAQFKKIYELLSKYSQVIIVGLANVGSKQVQDIRRILAKKNALLVIGKNTLFKKVLSTRVQDLPESHEYYDELKKFGGAIRELDVLKNQVAGKVGFIFTDTPVFDLKTVIEENKVETPARVGAVAPIDVVIPPGPTGMDPASIQFFHALQIPTKIEKGQIQITKDFVVLKTGQKVGQSQAVLLQKLGKKPFLYGMEVLACYDNGSILNKQQVSVNLNDIVAKFQKNVSNISAISLANGWVNEASAPYLLANAFKDLAAIGLQSGFIFDQIKQSNAPAQTSAPVATKVEEKPAQQAPAKVEEPEEDVDMGGLFD
ncbi:unnamed protein product [Paramecium sonneborni]|uniref:60S acidic ribosomal protein P0 n=1 Tax=Paramecium sonneborni TaxID=65129 RepID=A0A8S1M411_9CILI|nr:unnamed protein product [Paramecium sonneborni]